MNNIDNNKNGGPIRVRVFRPESMFDGQIGTVGFVNGETLWVNFDCGGGSFSKCEVEFLPNVEHAQGLRETLERILGIIDAHEITCFSCNRDGEEYCDCIDREANRARNVLKNIIATKEEKKRHVKNGKKILYTKY